MGTNMVGMKLREAAAQAASRIEAMPGAPKIIGCGLCSWKGLNYESMAEHYKTEHPGCVIPVVLNMTVNGKDCRIIIEPQKTLKEVLQFDLGLTLSLIHIFNSCYFHCITCFLYECCVRGKSVDY